MESREQPKESKCCCCFKMRTGVQLMASFVFLELCLAIFTLVTREPSQYIWDIANTTLKLVLFGGFAWSLKEEFNLNARRVLLFAGMVELTTQFVLGMGGLLILHFSDETRDWCIRKAKSENWFYDQDYNLVTEDGTPATYQTIAAC